MRRDSIDRDARRRRRALEIWRAGVDAVHAGRLVREHVRIEDGDLAVGELRFAPASLARILVVGGGKAGAAMAEAVESVLDSWRSGGVAVSGLVNVPDDEVRPLPRVELHGARSTHDNRPTAAGEAGARRMLELVSAAGPRDLVLCLLSGGASALLPAPAEGISLEDKQRVTDLLLASGAPITRMNAVRKHLSAVKGGGLARAAGEATVVSLIVSDVIGDPVDVIASGPTAPDRSTYAGALRVLETYRLAQKVPPSVLRRLRLGAAGGLPETARTLGDNVHNLVIGNNATALAAAADHAARLGYRVESLGSAVEGESRDVGAALAEQADAIRAGLRRGSPPVCLLSGGETTVSLRAPHGLGGPNQELVLSAAVLLAREGLEDMTVLSGGTDGEDGPTDAAGAFADASLLAAAERNGMEPSAYLERHDAHGFLDPLGGLLRTGPTDTNVMDLRVILIDAGRPPAP